MPGFVRASFNKVCQFGVECSLSQNREVQRDRLEAHNDYELNQKAEDEIRVILAHLSAQEEAMKAIHQQVLALARDS
jgi:uncharacterized membrane protein